MRRRRSPQRPGSPLPFLLATLAALAADGRPPDAPASGDATTRRESADPAVRARSWRRAPLAPPDAVSEELLAALVERETAPMRAMVGVPSGDAARVGAGAPLHPPGTLGESTSALDCLHAKHDITIDPATGKTSATLELAVKAKDKPLGAIGFTIDQGLAVDQAVVPDDRKGTIADQIYAPSRAVRLDVMPPLQPGEEMVVTLAYSGTLSCAAADGGAASCAKGRDFAYFAHQSIFPYIYDPEETETLALDALTREITLRVPSGLDVIATGQRASESSEDGQKVSRWTIDKPLSRVVGMYALAGNKLGKLSVDGRSVPTTLVFPTPQRDVDERLAGWSSSVLDFIERGAGTALPFDRSLSLVRLPETLRDPGTATFGMTLLSDSYAKKGDLVYEETWAHENAHLFWGIVVPETNSFESRLMTEGMATLLEIDYTRERRYAAEDRDLYLARRFVPIGLDIHAADVPPIQLPPGAPLDDAFRTKLYMLWAYYKPAATLDHLRATVGDDVFEDGLRAYMDRCRFVGCRPDVLREVLEARSGKDLRSFYDRWITGAERPEVVLAFTPSTDPARPGADVHLTKSDDAPMTLELWLGLDDGQRLRRHVELGGRATDVHVDAPAPVVSVAANPRHDVLVAVRSAVDGDLDFDGETDGFDVLRCAHLVGRSYTVRGATGLWDVDEGFDPRCDVDDDHAIGDEDLARLAETFGKLRTP